MTTLPKASFKPWMEVARAPADQQAALIEQVYRGLGRMSPPERMARLQQMEEGLYGLNDDQVRTFTRNRFRALLAMEPDEAQAATEPYGVLVDKLPGLTAMRHIAVFQTIVREFPLDDQVALRTMFLKAFASNSAASVPETKPASFQDRAAQERLTRRNPGGRSGRSRKDNAPIPVSVAARALARVSKRGVPPLRSRDNSKDGRRDGNR